MDPTRDSSPIAWDRVGEGLQGTVQELLQQVRSAYEQHPDDPARAIERTLRASIAELRGRFERATGGAS
jgi:hypothetical protein